MPLAGCTANISGDDGASGSGDVGSGGSGIGTAGSSNAIGGNVPLDPGTGLPQNCQDNVDAAAPAPLTRLTNREYTKTLGDLFPSAALPAPNLPVETKDDGFDNIGKNQAPTAVWVEAYFSHASELAEQMSAEIVSACGTDLDCAETAVASLAERAFRKSLEQDERTRLTNLWSEASTRWGLGRGAEVALRALLQAPQFLYRLEAGVPATGTAHLALTGHELAARLSYLLWDSMPDDELSAAARSGALTRPEVLEAQARRLLASPRARDAVAVFHSQWLRFEKMTNLNKSVRLFPDFDEATADALRASTERFVDSAFWEQRSLDSFLTSTTVFANGSMAALLGVQASGEQLTPVAAPAGQRAGILTQPGLLAGFAHETVGSAVLRGVFVLDRLLCSKPSPPPPNIPPPPTSDDAGAPTTTRQKFEQHRISPACNACHQTIDGIGFGFENYDAIGQYRSDENGIPVDASGELLGTLDADGPFTGAVELGERLARSKQTQACVARYWYRYTFGLSEDDVDSCALLPVVRNFQAAGLDLQELVVAIVKSSSFRTRPAVLP